MNYWAEHGEILRSNGYTIIPIYAPDSDKKGAGKRPIGKDWGKTKNTKEQVASWAKKYTNNGIGIVTDKTPAVDIDVYDKEASDHMANWVINKFGTVPRRIGRAPKQLFLFRTDEPFSKVKSGVWEDDFGQQHAVEILASGQQFVAYGIHPDTNKPYEWVGDESPLNNVAELDLVDIDLDGARAIADEFDRYAEEQGWERKKPPMNGTPASGNAFDDDDDWATFADVRKWERSYEELRDLVMKYPNPENYENYITVLAALQISCHDQDEAKDIAESWARQASNFDEGDFEYKWSQGFRHESTSLVSLGSIIKTVREIEEEEAVSKVDDFREGFQGCSTVAEWDAWASDFRKLRVFDLNRKVITDIARKAYRRLTESSLTPKETKQYLGFEYGAADTPSWLSDIVWVHSRKGFYNRFTGVLMDKGSFDAEFGRYLPEAYSHMNANKFATDICKIPVVDEMTYWPEKHGAMEGNTWHDGEGILGPDFFKKGNSLWLNTFSPDSIPKAADKYTPADDKAIEMIESLFDKLFHEGKDRRYVMDWLAWVVQNPTKRINYSLLIQGAQGTGKSTVGDIMRAVLGFENVSVVSNSVANGRFSSWAEGDILKLFEEVYDKGDRYGMLNRQKELITNDVLMVEGKGENARLVHNTSSKLMFTNFMNAVPLDDGQRRYLVISARASNKSEMADVYGTPAERDRFFAKVHHAIKHHAPAIRKWFLDYEISPDFNHKGHAPTDTYGFEMMRAATDDGVLDYVESVINKDETVNLCRNFIFSPALRSIFEDIEDMDLPKTSYLKHMLTDLGYVSVGLFSFEGVKGHLYIRKSLRRAFEGAGKFDSDWVRTEMKRRNNELKKKGVGVDSPEDVWGDD